MIDYMWELGKGRSRQIPEFCPGWLAAAIAAYKDNNKEWLQFCTFRIWDFWETLRTRYQKEVRWIVLAFTEIFLKLNDVIIVIETIDEV